MSSMATSILTADSSSIADSHTHDHHHNHPLLDSLNYAGPVCVHRFNYFVIRASRRDGENIIVSKSQMGDILRENEILKNKLREKDKLIDLLNTAGEYLCYIGAILAVGFVGTGLMLWKKW